MSSQHLTKTQWNKLAAQWAFRAHRHLFSTRRDWRYLRDMDATVIINNHPYADDPDQRDRETNDLIQRLAQHGIAALAYASYPEDGYSYALIVNAREDQADLIEELIYAAVDNSWGRMEARRNN